MELSLLDPTIDLVDNLGTIEELIHLIPTKDWLLVSTGNSVFLELFFLFGGQRTTGTQRFQVLIHVLQVLIPIGHVPFEKRTLPKVFLKDEGSSSL